MSTQRFSAAFLIFFFAGITTSFGQTQPKPKLVTINLTNPSFEDIPRAGSKGGTAPAGWYDCGPQTESSPDIQPGFFDVIKPPSNGISYLGLVVRDNETYESVSQRLSQPIVAGNCYEWNLDLSRSDEYNSQTSNSGSKVLSFASAVQVRIWGGNGFCDRKELLYTTPYVVNTRWMGYLIPLKPKKGNYSFIIIEAYFKTPMLFPYNGNVLIDNASAIKQTSCDEKKEDVAAKPEVKRTTPPGKATPPKPATTKEIPAVTPAPKVETVKTIAESDPTKIKKGDILQIQNLYFDANQYTVKAECETTLSEVYNFLSKNPKLVIEVAGHTNNRPSDSYANTLSANRAKAVCDWLISKGIPTARIQYKGYGKTLPIAPNTTEDGRRKNQRVEIRVLSVTG
jgi:outer membrane protein OmpA-like peptidoglycan-associated protein